MADFPPLGSFAFKHPVEPGGKEVRMAPLPPGVQVTPDAKPQFRDDILKTVEAKAAADSIEETEIDPEISERRSFITKCKERDVVLIPLDRKPGAPLREGDVLFSVGQLAVHYTTFNPVPEESVDRGVSVGAIWFGVVQDGVMPATSQLSHLSTALDAIYSDVTTPGPLMAMLKSHFYRVSLEADKAQKENAEKQFAESQTRRGELVRRAPKVQPGQKTNPSPPAKASSTNRASASSAFFSTANVMSRMNQPSIKRQMVTGGPSAASQRVRAGTTSFVEPPLYPSGAGEHAIMSNYGRQYPEVDGSTERASTDKGEKSVKSVERLHGNPVLKGSIAFTTVPRDKDKAKQAVSHNSAGHGNAVDGASNRLAGLSAAAMRFCADYNVDLPTEVTGSLHPFEGVAPASTTYIIGEGSASALFQDLIMHLSKTGGEESKLLSKVANAMYRMDGQISNFRIADGVPMDTFRRSMLCTLGQPFPLSAIASQPVVVVVHTEGETTVYRPAGVNEDFAYVFFFIEARDGTTVQSFQGWAKAINCASIKRVAKQFVSDSTFDTAALMRAVCLKRKEDTQPILSRLEALEHIVQNLTENFGINPADSHDLTIRQFCTQGDMYAGDAINIDFYRPKLNRTFMSPASLVHAAVRGDSDWDLLLYSWMSASPLITHNDRNSRNPELLRSLLSSALFAIKSMEQKDRKPYVRCVIECTTYTSASVLGLFQVATRKTLKAICETPIPGSLLGIPPAHLPPLRYGSYAATVYGENLKFCPRSGTWNCMPPPGSVLIGSACTYSRALNIQDFQAIFLLPNNERHLAAVKIASVVCFPVSLFEGPQSWLVSGTSAERGVMFRSERERKHYCQAVASADKSYRDRLISGRKLLRALTHPNHPLAESLLNVTEVFTAGQREGSFLTIEDAVDLLFPRSDIPPYPDMREMIISSVKAFGVLMCIEPHFPMNLKWEEHKVLNKDFWTSNTVIVLPGNALSAFRFGTRIKQRDTEPVLPTFVVPQRKNFTCPTFTDAVRMPLS